MSAVVSNWVIDDVRFGPRSAPAKLLAALAANAVQPMPRQIDAPVGDLISEVSGTLRLAVYSLCGRGA